MQIYFLFSQIVTNENCEIENFSTLFHRFSVGKAQINTKIPYFAACFSAFGIKKSLVLGANKASLHPKQGSFSLQNGLFCCLLLCFIIAHSCLSLHQCVVY